MNENPSKKRKRKRSFAERIVSTVLVLGGMLLIAWTFWGAKLRSPFWIVEFPEHIQLEKESRSAVIHATLFNNHPTPLEIQQLDPYDCGCRSEPIGKWVKIPPFQSADIILSVKALSYEPEKGSLHITLKCRSPKQFFVDLGTRYDLKKS